MTLRNVLRDVAVSYLFGNKEDDSGAIKSRASKAAICAYYMHYPNSILSMKTTREAIRQSSIQEDEKKHLSDRLDAARNRWTDIVNETIKNLSDSNVQESESEVEIDDDLDDDLPSGSNDNLVAERTKYATFPKNDYRKWRSRPDVVQLLPSQQAEKFWIDHNQIFPIMSQVARMVSSKKFQN